MRHRVAFALTMLVACGSPLPLDASDAGDAGEDVTLADAPFDGGVEASPDTCTNTSTICSGACVELASDPKNCGKCGHDCLGGACDAGTCLPVQIGPANNGLDALVADATNLYWLGGDTIYRMSKNGGPVEVLVSFLKTTRSIAINGTQICFPIGGQGANAGSIMTLPIDADGGVAPTTLYDLQDSPYAIAVDATNVYWTNRGNLTTTGAVMQGPLVKGAITPLATGLDDPDTIAIDNAYVYWGETGSQSGLVSKTPIGGGTITPLATGGNPSFVEPTPEGVFFVALAQSSVYIDAIASDGGVSVAATLTESPGDLTFDTKYLYYTSGNYPGTVNAVALDGSGTTLISGPKGVPDGIVVDDVAIYWLDRGPNNALWKLAK